MTMYSTRMVAALAFGASILLVAMPAAAAILAPAKPSDVRTAKGDSNGPPCPSGISKLVSTLEHPDGSLSAFSVPVGKNVFVITSWDWYAIGASGGLAAVDLAIEGPSGSIATVSFGRAVAAPTTGAGGGTVVVPAGIIVKGGSHVCFVGSGTLSAVVVHGFFTKDK